MSRGGTFVVVDILDPQPTGARLAVQTSSDGHCWYEIASESLHAMSSVVLRVDDTGAQVRWAARGITSDHAFRVRFYEPGRSKD